MQKWANVDISQYDDYHVLDSAPNQPPQQAVIKRKNKNPVF